MNIEPKASEDHQEHLEIIEDLMQEMVDETDAVVVFAMSKDPEGRYDGCCRVNGPTSIIARGIAEVIADFTDESREGWENRVEVLADQITKARLRREAAALQRELDA